MRSEFLSHCPFTTDTMLTPCMHCVHESTVDSWCTCNAAGLRSLWRAVLQRRAQRTHALHPGIVSRRVLDAKKLSFSVFCRGIPKKKWSIAQVRTFLSKKVSMTRGESLRKYHMRGQSSNFLIIGPLLYATLWHFQTVRTIGES